MENYSKLQKSKPNPKFLDSFRKGGLLYKGIKNSLKSLKFNSTKNSPNSTIKKINVNTGLNRKSCNNLAESSDYFIKKIHKIYNKKLSNNNILYNTNNFKKLNTNLLINNSKSSKSTINNKSNRINNRVNLKEKNDNSLNDENNNSIKGFIGNYSLIKHIESSAFLNNNNNININVSHKKIPSAHQIHIQNNKKYNSNYNKSSYPKFLVKYDTNNKNINGFPKKNIIVNNNNINCYSEYNKLSKTSYPNKGNTNISLNSSGNINNVNNIYTNLLYHNNVGKNLENSYQMYNYNSYISNNDIKPTGNINMNMNIFVNTGGNSNTSFNNTTNNNTYIDSNLFNKSKTNKDINNINIIGHSSNNSFRGLSEIQNIKGIFSNSNLSINPNMINNNNLIKSYNSNIYYNNNDNMISKTKSNSNFLYSHNNYSFNMNPTERPISNNNSNNNLNQYKNESELFKKKIFLKKKDYTLSFNHKHNNTNINNNTNFINNNEITSTNNNNTNLSNINNKETIKARLVKNKVPITSCQSPLNTKSNDKKIIKNFFVNNNNKITKISVNKSKIYSSNNSSKNISINDLNEKIIISKEKYKKNKYISAPHKNNNIYINDSDYKNSSNFNTGLNNNYMNDFSPITNNKILNNIYKNLNNKFNYNKYNNNKEKDSYNENSSRLFNKKDAYNNKKYNKEHVNNDLDAYLMNEYNTDINNISNIINKKGKLYNNYIQKIIKDKPNINNNKNEIDDTNDNNINLEEKNLIINVPNNNNYNDKCLSDLTKRLADLNKGNNISSLKSKNTINKEMNEKINKLTTVSRDCTYYRKEKENLENYIKQFHKETGTYPKTKMEFYLYGRQIGHGAFGKVNLALQVATGRLVAIKTFTKKNLKNKHSKQKIIHEIDMLSRLRHPFISQILDSFETDKHIFIVMEYICGDLLGFIRKRAKLSEAVTKIIFKQIMEGLRYIHRKHIVHRDIKLDNVLIDLTNTVKICDFGVSRKLNPGDIMHEHCGTPAYIAPEIFENRGYEGYQCDVWSAGVTLYYMLAGVQPFRASTLKDLEKIVIKGKFEKLDDISNEANDLINGMLRTDPKKRLTVDQVLNHPWLVNVNLNMRNQLNLFTDAEKILLSKFDVDYLTSDRAELIENFTNKNLETNQDLSKAAGNTKSIIFAPYNSYANSKDKISKQLKSIYKNIEIHNSICKFGYLAQQANIKYELSNNKDFDNGVIKTQKEEDLKKENDIIEKNMLGPLSGRVSGINSPKPRSANDSFEESEKIDINKDILKYIEDNIGFDRKYVIGCLKKNKINYATGCYYMLSREYPYM